MNAIDRPEFDDVPDGLVVVDADAGVVRDANRAFCALLGADRATVVGSEVAALLADDDAASVAGRIGRETDAGPARDRWTLRTEAGDPVPADVRYAPLEGAPAGHVLVSVRDVSASEAYRRELEEYRRRLDGAMFAGNLAWWEMDVETGAVQFHENKTDMLGYAPSEFERYEDFTDLVYPEDHERMMDAMRDHLEGEAERYDAEYRIETADGEWRWFHDVGGVTERGPDGAPEKVTGIVVDISARKETEARLREQNEQLALLNRLVRHDIRNDLSIATGWLDVLLEDAPPDRRADLRRVKDATEHAVELTHSARDFATAIVEGGDVDLEPVDLAEAVRTEVDRVGATYPHATVAVEGSVPEVPVLADLMLTGVLRNLLHNAVQHSDREHPEVDVSVSERPETVVFSVADDGPGLPDARKETIFERGELGPDSEGTGLGLYLVQSLVAAYGGEVWVEDNEPRGAVFRVELRKADDG
ncbi:MAG: PAS domain S-box protein [Halobacteriaceae archaeon]